MHGHAFEKKKQQIKKKTIEEHEIESKQTAFRYIIKKKYVRLSLETR